MHLCQIDPGQVFIVCSVIAGSKLDKNCRVNWPEVVFLAESRITVWTLPIVWNAANTSIKAKPSKNTFKFLTVCCSILFVFLLFSSEVCHELNVWHKMNVSLSSQLAINN